ncbi:FIG00979822: hypothetical protein [hydrothermal vent metagenome]|uniref:Chromosome partition protein smc n=1 Tax=hydrothermal vent metagenome TaxID=652676 RepID=A0A3B0YBE7_9ZZZZ
MFLKKFIFVNWGNIPQLEFELGPVNLMSGGNGSGKTTAADAIQTIMTAAHENLFQYNPGQDETTQRGRGGKRVRTLASYVLGCDDGSYARLDPTDGYLAAVFSPTTGESAEAFTAVIGVRAWLDATGGQRVARQDELLFFILPGEELTLEHFIREGKTGGKHTTPLDTLQSLLIREFGQARVQKYDAKKAYLRRLYAILRGKDDSVSEQEATAAARAFSRFMAYKPVRSISDFVAHEILERKDLGEAIRSISGQLKTIHAMERDAARLLESIGILEDAEQHAGGYIHQWIELNTLDFTLAQHDYLQRQHDYLQARKKQDNYRRNLKENASETELAEQRLQQLHEQLVQLEAQRMGISALQQKDELEQQREQQHSTLTDMARRLLVQDNSLDNNLQTTRAIEKDLQDASLIEDLPAAADLQVLQLARKVIQEGGRGELDIPALLQKNLLNDISPLEQHLDQARTAQRLHNQWCEQWRQTDSTTGSPSLYEQLAKLAHNRETRYEKLKTQCRQKSQDIERLQAQQVSYPAFVERALIAIRRDCPQADPRVLCDHVDVSDPRWQMAIEGYLGMARFSIIVDADYEAEAIGIVRRLPGRDNRARIIQGAKAQSDAEHNQLPTDSIIHLLSFSHATAKHYLTASYGNVVQVPSAETLRNTRRGLTADGMGASGYSMFRCDLPDGELVFGQGARERALKAKQQELERLNEEWQQANERMQRVSRVLDNVKALQPLDYADTITYMLGVHRELQKLENLLAQLDLSEHRELEDKLTDLREQLQQLRQQQGDLKQASGELQEKIRKITERCKHLADAQDATLQVAEDCEQKLLAIVSDWPEFDADARLTTAEKEADDLNAEVATQLRRETDKLLHSQERKMGEAIQRHNQHCLPGDAIVYHSFNDDYDSTLFSAICGLQRDIDRVYNRLKNNILVEKYDNLRQLKDSFNNAFVTHFCHTIHQAINDGKRQIELLNKELQHHKFGDDREGFRFDSHWIPEFRGYARFFEEVIKQPSMSDEVDLFDMELTEKSQQVREELLQMLLSDDETQALRELERIGDYRNYQKYEIYKEVEDKQPIALSEYGTGSGGQLETPAYIIRSAAITSAFRFAEGSNHLRVVLVDEAFSKMDETRSREVINYLTQALGLQLIFIMPTSKCGPFMDLISNEFVFAKCPSEQPRGQLNTRVLVDRKQCNTEKIQQLWANHKRTVYQQAELDFMDDVLAVE